MRNDMAQDAVLRWLETLADATHRLADDLKARHPHIPWAQIYRFRNVAAHDYEHMDQHRIWETVTAHLPPLKQAIAAEIRPLPKQPRG